MSSRIKVVIMDELFEMESALVSGRMLEHENAPISLYAGPLDLDDIHTTLFYANRAIIRLLTEECGIPLDSCDEFLISALTEAMVKEQNARNGMSDDVDSKKVVKYRSKKQN